MIGKKQKYIKPSINRLLILIVRRLLEVENALNKQKRLGHLQIPLLINTLKTAISFVANNKVEKPFDQKTYVLLRLGHHVNHVNLIMYGENKNYDGIGTG